jgi:type IV secretory pathway VirB2 component (pilin)
MKIWCGDKMKKFKNVILSATIPVPILIPPTGNNLSSKIQNIIQVLLMFAGAIAIIFIIIGGFQFIFAAGNEENIKRARNSIIYSIVGLVIILLSYVIVGFVIQKLK